MKPLGPMPGATAFLPAPQAYLITGITQQANLAQGVLAYQFAQQIEPPFITNGTIGIGYNTIGFGDEITRHLFWRNLIGTYACEWQNQFGRWAILDLVPAPGRHRLAHT